MNPAIIAALIIVFLLLILLPFFNRNQFNKLPYEQKVRVLMKEAKGLIYFKNVSSGSSGTLYYVKNKRKIYSYPWILKDGKMRCTRTDLFTDWDYPADSPQFTDEEREQAIKELINYNEGKTVKLYIDYEA